MNRKNISENIYNKRTKLYKIISCDSNINCYIQDILFDETKNYLNNYFFYDKYQTNKKYEIHLIIDNEIVDLIENKIYYADISDIECYRVFREWTNKEFYYSINLFGYSIFYSNSWEGTYLIKLNNYEFAMIVKNMSSFKVERLMYVIREILRKSKLNDKGALMLHSACINIDNLGVLLMGTKNAGKTTALCHLLNNNYRAKFISNDRTLLLLNKNNGDLWQFPQNIRLNKSMLNTFYDLKKGVEGKYKIYNPYKIGIKKCDNVSKSKLALMPKEFINLMNCGVEHKCKLSIIINVEIVINSNVFLYRKMNSDEKNELIKSNNLFNKDDLYIDDWIMKNKTDHDFTNVTDWLLKHVKFVKLSYGSNISSKEFQKKFDILIGDNL